MHYQDDLTHAPLMGGIHLHVHLDILGGMSKPVHVRDMSRMLNIHAFP